MIISSIGDLTPLAKKLEQVITDHFKLKERPTMAIAFTLPQDYAECHWVTNIPRGKGITLLKNTAEKMQAQIN